MRIVDIIEKKKNGNSLDDEEIAFFIEGFVKGEIPDYQASALLMAICLKGMLPKETAALTIAMANSGKVVNLSAIPGIKVDKHSTGGVGDTTTLITLPLAASCGVPIAKMSGRGLGHTGGTIDKLEAIPGVNVSRGIDDFIEIVKSIGLAVNGQTGDLVPADRLMYALRDVTATVNSIPLIASSIMSKKIASGCDAIVLDVKTGNGAFMGTVEDSFELARTMVAIGKAAYRETIAIITDMNQPLGLAVGNLLEVCEAIEALSGKIKYDEPLMQVSLLLAEHMLILGKVADNHDIARTMLIKALESGAAIRKLGELICAVGGDITFIEDPHSFINAKYVIKLYSPQSGYINTIQTNDLGVAAQILGAGRSKKTDKIDPNVGFVLCKRIGEWVNKGDPIASIYANDKNLYMEASEIIINAIGISNTIPMHSPIIYGEIT